MEETGIEISSADSSSKIADRDNLKERINKYGTLTAINKILKYAIQYHKALAAWRQPGGENIHIIVDLSGDQPSNIHPDLENMHPGFLASPYYNEANYINYFIKADIHLTCTLNGWFDIQPLSERTDKSQLNKYLDEILNEEDLNTYGHSGSFADPQPDLPEISENEFKNIVISGIEQIRNGRFLKVVPSRRKLISLPAGFSAISMYLKMVIAYPQAFVSIFYIPEKGLWIGATPEILIKIDDNQHFYTAALAGTQNGKGVEDLSVIAWTQKEIEEQALVSRYIINCFKKIRLREFNEYGPKTVKAGNLLHLRTDFSVDMNAVNFPRLGSVMLRLLHPTSAVCGMPREPAFEFLREHEKYDREFYSGYLGPVNVDEKTTLYVNLRCARILDKIAYVYSGAGVTMGSNPDKEWKETEIKNQTIEDFILHS